MKVNKHIFLFALLLVVFQCGAQKSGSPDVRKLFEQAEKDYIAERYDAALPLYLNMDLILLDDANIAYKIGVCYLHSQIDKIKAIPYLERAIKNVSIKANDTDFKEKSASIDAYYQLGHAYHLNNLLDSAVTNFKTFKSFLDTTEKALAEVNHQIEMCANAKELMQSPVTIKIENLGPNVNSPDDDYSAVVPADESTLFFTSRRPGTTGGGIDAADGKPFEDIYFCTKKDSIWMPAVNIGPPINTNGNEASIGISVDGQQMLIYKDDKGDGNIYTSTLEGGAWTVPVKLNENINTEGWEPSASISADGMYLYFSSNRPGGYGGRDLYMSKQLPNRQWSKAINLGPKVNTPYDEDCPFIHPDGTTLFFSSNGHKSMGGFDIFFSIRSDDTARWSEPLNIGYPVNSTDDDIFYTPTADNKRAYYSSLRPGGLGGKDIYMVTFPEQKQAQLTVYKGKINSVDGGSIPNVEITVIDNITGTLVGSYFPNSKTGNYLFILPPGGNYNITYQAEGYLLQSENMIVPKDSVYSLINSSIQLKSITVGQRVTLKNIFFDKAKSTLRPMSIVELDKFCQMLNEKPKLVVEISGHTDSKGKPEFDMKLSRQRAHAVIEYLVKKGIDRRRMRAVGYGDTKPIARNKKSDGTDDLEGMQLNRRVEYRVLSTEGELEPIEKTKVK